MIQLKNKSWFFFSRVADLKKKERKSKYEEEIPEMSASQWLSGESEMKL